MKRWTWKQKAPICYILPPADSQAMPPPHAARRDTDNQIAEKYDRQLRQSAISTQHHIKMREEEASIALHKPERAPQNFAQAAQDVAVAKDLPLHCRAEPA